MVRADWFHPVLGEAQLRLGLRDTWFHVFRAASYPREYYLVVDIRPHPL